MKRAIGIDIGGTKCAVSFGAMQNDSLSILQRKEIPTLGTPFELMSNMADIAAEMIEAFGKPDVCGIVCGGPLDSKNGLVLSPPNLPGWHNIKVTEFFTEKLSALACLINLSILQAPCQDTRRTA